LERAIQPQITGLLEVLADELQRQYFYLACIGSWSEADRTGPEFDDPDRGEYRLEEVPLTVQALDAVSPDPEEITALLREAVRAGPTWPPWQIPHGESGERAPGRAWPLTAAGPQPACPVSGSEAAAAGPATVFTQVHGAPHGRGARRAAARRHRPLLLKVRTGLLRSPIGGRRPNLG
jgi:hypothetical protein